MTTAITETIVFRGAPLWPAGHLPLKGGDRLSSTVSPTSKFRMSGQMENLAISPLEGEMSGRTEGGTPGRSIRHPFLGFRA